MSRAFLALAIALTAGVATSAHAERGGKVADPLLAPENVMCTIDGTAMEVVVEWGPVAGAAKYSVDFECEDPTGTMEMDAEYEPEERLIGTLAAVPFDAFPVEVLLEGEGAWTCMAKVKGLNPPGKKQSHPQGVALCE